MRNRRHETESRLGGRVAVTVLTTALLILFSIQMMSSSSSREEEAESGLNQVDQFPVRPAWLDMPSSQRPPVRNLLEWKSSSMFTFQNSYFQTLDWMEYERLTPGYVAAVAQIRRGRLVTPQSVASPGSEYIGTA